MKRTIGIAGALGLIYMFIGTFFTSIFIFDPTRIPAIKEGISSPLWLTGTGLFLSSYIFSYVVNFLLNRYVLLKTSIVVGLVSILSLLTGWLLTTENFGYALFLFVSQCGISFICWLSIVKALLSKNQPTSQL